MKRQIFNKNQDVIFACIGLVLASVMTFMIYFVQPMYVSMGITLFLACLIYLLSMNKLSNIQVECFELKFRTFNKKSLFLAFNIMFILLFTLSIISLYLELYERPMIYFLLTATVCVIVSIEIFIHNNSWLILAKILALAVSLRASLYYLFPGLVTSDPYYWFNLVNFTLEEGYLLKNIVYYHYPIFNLIVSITSLIAKIDIKNAMFLSIGIFELFGTVYVYLIGKMVSNSKLGLIAALLLGVSQFHIRMGSLIFQMSIGLGIFTLIIYFFFKKMHSNNTLFKFILLFLILLMVITHHLSSFILQIAFISMLVGQLYLILLCSEESKINNLSISIYIMSIISMLAYWMFNGSWQFEHLAKSLANIFQDTVSNDIIITPIKYDFVTIQLKQAGILIFILLSIIGSLYYFSLKENNNHKLILTFGGGILSLSIFAFIFIGFNSAVINRWFPFAYVLLALPASQGIIIIVNNFKSTRNKLLVLAFVIFIFSFIMMTTYNEDLEPSIYTDSQIFWRYLDSDIVSANNLLNIINTTEISSDDRYFFYLDSHSNDYNTTFFNNNSKGTLIIREIYLNEYQVFSIENKGGIEKNSLEKLNGTEMVIYNDKINTRFYDSFYIKSYVA